MGWYRLSLLLSAVALSDARDLSENVPAIWTFPSTFEENGGCFDVRNANRNRENNPFDCENKPIRTEVCACVSMTASVKKPTSPESYTRLCGVCQLGLLPIKEHYADFQSGLLWADAMKALSTDREGFASAGRFNIMVLPPKFKESMKVAQLALQSLTSSMQLSDSRQEVKHMFLQYALNRLMYGSPKMDATVYDGNKDIMESMNRIDEEFVVPGLNALFDKNGDPTQFVSDLVSTLETETECKRKYKGAEFKSKAKTILLLTLMRNQMLGRPLGLAHLDTEGNKQMTDDLDHFNSVVDEYYGSTGGVGGERKIFGLTGSGQRRMYERFRDRDSATEPPYYGQEERGEGYPQSGDEQAPNQVNEDESDRPNRPYPNGKGSGRMEWPYRSYEEGAGGGNNLLRQREEERDPASEAMDDDDEEEETSPYPFTVGKDLLELEKTMAEK